MFVLRAGIHKMLVIANREVPDQTASSVWSGSACLLKQSDLGLDCLSRLSWQATSDRNLEHLWYVLYAPSQPIRKYFLIHKAWALTHYLLGNFSSFFIHWFVSKSTFLKNSFSNIISVQQFGSRSGPTFCRAWSGSKLFAKVISRWH